MRSIISLFLLFNVITNTFWLSKNYWVPPSSCLRRSSRIGSNDSSPITVIFPWNVIKNNYYWPIEQDQTYRCFQFNQTGFVFKQWQHILIDDGDFNVVGFGHLADGDFLQVQNDSVNDLLVECDIVLDNIPWCQFLSVWAAGEDRKSGLHLLDDFDGLGWHVAEILAEFL